MLKQRVLTAVVLASVLLWAIFAWPASGFHALLALVAALAAKEWGELAFLSSAQSWGFALATGVLAMLSFSLALPDGMLMVSALTSGLWLLMSGWLLSRDHAPAAPPHAPAWGLLALGLAIILGTVLCLAWLRHVSWGGAALLLYSFSIVWAADIGAYFAGRRFGREKLAPGISPGKTWEGAYGGFAAVCVLYLLGLSMLDRLGGDPMALLVATAVAAVFSVLGDLFESALKRRRGVKDSGTLLPGHGGVLDRIDSVLAAAPWFVLCLLALR